MEKRRALEGVKIADFSWMVTGPGAMKFAANLGAKVIHIESNTRPDIVRFSPPWKDNDIRLNTSGLFTHFNDSKYGITLNLKTPQAQKVAKRIIYDWANVVADAHLPGVMERLGLDYETLRKEKPDLIHVATALQGKTGPCSGMPGHGIIGAQLSGFREICGWPDKEAAVPWQAYTDYIAFPHMLIALIAALIYRDRTGKGQYIDVSQFESSVQFLAPPIMDYLINGRIMKRMGNCSTHAAPHAIYRCQGDDRWCAISVSSDEEWSNFRKVIGEPDWAGDPRFATLRSRKQNEDGLNALVESWTVNHPPQEVMSLMQAAGVPAGLAAKGEDLVGDPQLNHRGTHVVLDHPEIGPHIHQPPPYQLSKTPCELTMPAPCIGQHNEYILKEVLGMSDEEVAELVITGALE